jgi:hypothetical protein
MGLTQSVLRILLGCWGAITAMLTILVIYGNTLSLREDTELYLNRTEEIMMESEQEALARKMSYLKPVIMVLATLSGVLLLTSYAVWVWAVVGRF